MPIGDARLFELMRDRIDNLPGFLVRNPGGPEHGRHVEPGDELGMVGSESDAEAFGNRSEAAGRHSAMKRMACGGVMRNYRPR
jgi:hypothetical protein